MKILKKVNFNESKFSKFLKGKGFYVALCGSIVAVGAAGFVAYNQTASKLENQLNNPAPSVTTPAKQWGYEDFTDANVPKKDVPVETTTAPAPTVVVTSPQANVPTSAQPIVLPLNGEVANAYSSGNLVKSKTLGSWKTHDGVDLKGTLGDSVKAMTGGKVVDVLEDPMWGVCVIINHNDGYEGHYYNLNKVVTVKVGQTVSAGTVLGSIGDSAQCEIAEGGHLHFGLKKDGAWTDPLAIIGTR